MATSPNFSWPEPDNTDLVKNGALAIRTAVNAIDSSLVDLKGGTTGQILAKTSNTDMDFTWVANDVGDITGVTASTPLTGGGTSGAITVGIQDATTSVKGAVQLSDSTSTTSSILAATPTAVKAAYDLANTASTNNNNITMIQQYTATESVLKNIPSRVPAAEQLLKQAVYWIDAAQSDNSDQVLDNQGWGAPALTTQLGSSASADSNDPKFLDFNGTNYVYLTGVDTNNLSVPDAAALDITGDIDIRAYVAFDDWTPSTNQQIITKDDLTGAVVRTQASFDFGITSAGLLNLQWFTAGTTASRISVVSSVAPTVSDGAALWVRATLDVDNGASGNDVKFFTSTDGVTYTQLGTTVTTASTTSIYAGTALLKIGQVGTYGSELMVGKVYRAQVFNGIAGTKVLDIDTSIIGSGSATSFNALTGQTVTINRSTSGKKTAVVTHPVWLFGTDDYMTVADNDLLDFAATDPFTVIAITRTWSGTTGFGSVITKNAPQGAVRPGYSIYFNNSSVTITGVISDASTRVNANALTVTTGSLQTLSLTRNVSADTVAIGGTTAVTDTTTTTLASTATLDIGFGSGFVDMELIAAAIFRTALTTDQITTITNYYTARVGA